MRSLTLSRPYQGRGIDRAHRQSHLLWDIDMGLGKTLMTYVYLHEILQHDPLTRVLVLTVPSAPHSVWMAEAKKWGFPHSVQVVDGGPAKRLKLLANPKAVNVMSMNVLKWYDGLVDRIKDRFNILIIDESHCFKSYKSTRFKVIKKYSFERTLLLTGTAAAEEPEELWSQCYLLDGGKALGRSITAFRDSFMMPHPYTENVWVMRPSMALEVWKRAAPLVFTLRKEDHLKLPELIHIPVPVTVPPKVHELYKRMAKELAIEHKGAEITAVNAAVAAGKLGQIASGAIYENEDYDGKRETVYLHTAKVDALADLVAGADSPMVVAYSYKFTPGMIEKKIPGTERFDKSAEQIERWNKGDIPVLLAQWQSIAESVNLQDGGCIWVWFDDIWPNGKRQQAEARLHRGGQTRPVRVYSLRAEGLAIEKLRVARMSNKQSMEDTMRSYFASIS